MCRVNFLLLLTLYITISAVAQQSPVNTLGYGDQWILGTLYAEAVQAIIDDATITDPADYFADDRILQILCGLHGRLNILETGGIEPPTQSFHIVGDLYGVAEIFSVTKTEWRIEFPPNQRLKPDGTFLLFIGGMSFGSTARIIKGYGFQDAGIQVRLSDEWYWRVSTDARGLFQLSDASFWDASAGLTGEEITAPKHVPGDLLAHSVTGL